MIWPFGTQQHKTGTDFKHLRSGCRYYVVTPFFDHDGIGHPVGENWTFKQAAFLPYEDGLTLHVEKKKGVGQVMRLQWRPETEGAIIDALETYLSAEPPAREPTISLRLTRDSVCMADDIDAPHESVFHVKPDADIEEIAWAVMVQNRLAHVGPTGIWSLTLGDDHVVFGIKEGRRFVRPVRQANKSLRAQDAEALHLRYHAQQEPPETK